MSDAVLAIGTRKGLFLARSAGRRPVRRRADPVLHRRCDLGGHRHARHRAPDPRGHRVRPLRPFGRCTPTTSARPGRRSERPPHRVPREDRRDADPGVAARAVTDRARGGLGRGGAGRAVPLGRPRRRPTSWSRACGSTPTGSTGSRAAAGCACTRSSVIRPTRRSWGSRCRRAASIAPPTAASRGRPPTGASARRSCWRAAISRIRAVRARVAHATRPGPSGFFLQTPLRRLPQRRLRRFLARHRLVAAVRLRLPDRGPSHPARHALRAAAERRHRPHSGRPPLPGLPQRRRGRNLAAAGARAARGAGVRECAA